MTATLRPDQRAAISCVLPSVRLVLVLASVMSLLVTSSAWTQPASDRPSLITPAGLAARLADPSVVLLHVSDEANYATGHIAGARHVTPTLLSAPRGEGRLTLELPDPNDLRDRLMALGIGNASTVVVYYADNWISQAARIVFTLDAAGLGGRTRLLDGGLAAWRAAGHPVTDAPPESVARPTDLTLMPRPDVVATLDEVRALTVAPGRTRIVDARTADFYSGANDRRGEIPRPGHVPGAVSLPYLDFFERAPGGGDTAPQVLKPRATLEAMFAAAGLTPGTSLVTYCHIGQQATVPFFVARLLGYDVRLFDGSFEEWSANTSVPVAKN